ncbi:MAG: hypothetical protein ACD_19C00079G0036 [uncultured bacterium]|nr:MAG: hypothetical protein ACD_19C00079G0036 [uncultured bacterium]
MYKLINLFILFLFLITSIVYLFYPKISLSSETVGDWSNITSTTTATASQYSFIVNDKLYSLGGANTSTFPNGLYSPIISDGTITNWTNISSPPNVLWHSGTVHTNHVYLLGGANSSLTNISDSKLGTIDISGDITSWINTTPLPFSLSLGATVVVGNRVYYAGGSTSEENSSYARSEIYMADINTTDGTLGPWTLAGNLPQPMLGFGMVESNGYLIILGGKATGNIYLSDVKKAPIDSLTGNVGSWSPLPALPDPVYRAGVTKAGNMVVSAGGYYTTPTFTLMDKVNFAEININGDIASWTESEFTLPQPTCCFSLSSWNNFIYMIGGWIGSYVNDVYVSKIETVTTTPTPIIPIIDVPDLKQYSEPWQSNLYDHTPATIKQWGCALTSASMILKYHGHDITPDVLNNWLNSQSDGYLRNGLTNWLAISRYTKLNDSLTSPTLEYKRLNPTENNLDNELTNNRPAILKEPGHFVVGTGKLTDTYTINDPGYASRTTLLPYSNLFSAINSYTPTHSNLSYMMFTVDDDIILELIDSNGNVVPTQNYIEDPIEDIDDPNNKSGDSLSVLLFEKPDSGSYKLKISGNAGTYNLNTYLYNVDGVVTQNNFEGILIGGDTDIYNINYSTNSNIGLSIDGIINNLDSAYQNKLIKNKGIYIEIKMHLKLYKRLGQKKIIKLLITRVKAFTPRFIDQTYSLTLQQNLRTLID